jgi:hypothetical protein
MAVGAISMRNMGASKVNRHYESALSCIDRQLTMIDYIGIDAFIETGETEGAFEDVEPGYYWQVFAVEEPVGNLYTVTITVSWLEGRKPYSLTVDTRLNGQEQEEQMIVPTTGQQ